MDYKSLLTIVILILISSQLWNIIWDIGKGSVYILLLLVVLTYLEPTTGEKIKEFIKKIINLDFSFVTNIFSSISIFILSLFNKLPKFNNINAEETTIIPSTSELSKSDKPILSNPSTTVL